MSEDLEERYRRQLQHTFCKKFLARKRKEYKCSQIRIAALSDPCGAWHIYIDPEGYVGAYGHCCCKWEAMLKALDDKFAPKKN